MAKEITKWEAETNPPTVHDKLKEAVIAELAELLGYRGNNESEAASLAIGIASKIVAAPETFIQTIAQLVAIEGGNS